MNDIDQHEPPLSNELRDIAQDLARLIHGGAIVGTTDIGKRMLETVKHRLLIASGQAYSMEHPDRRQPRPISDVVRCITASRLMLSGYRMPR